MVCPFFLTLLLRLPLLTLTPLVLIIIFLYICPPATQMLIITPFFVMPYVPGTHYLTLLHHYLALIYLKRLCLIIYSYCCACTVLFLLRVHTRISTIVAIYVSHVFWHKLLYTKKKKKKKIVNMSSVVCKISVLLSM